MGVLILLVLYVVFLTFAVLYVTKYEAPLAAAFFVGKIQNYLKSSFIYNFSLCFKKFCTTSARESYFVFRCLINLYTLNDSSASTSLQPFFSVNNCWGKFILYEVLLILFFLVSITVPTIISLQLHIMLVYQSYQ